jgi:hypothetical protein
MEDLHMPSQEKVRKPASRQRAISASKAGAKPTQPVKWPQVTEAMHRAEMEWLKQNGPQYEGQWVALEGARLLSHGPDALEVLKEARAQGVASPLLVEIPLGPELPFGGW